MIHDMIWGDAPEHHGSHNDDEVFVYSMLLASLNEGDAKLMTQLRRSTPSDNKKIAFKHLGSLEFQRSIIPFATDENPLGEVPATAVAIVCEDKSWGPDLRKDDASELNYYQIIDAAQDVAERVVFIFVKNHKDSETYDGVCHPKFVQLAKGPWPKKFPHVFIMSFYHKFNQTQIDVIRNVLNLQDDMQVQLEITKHMNLAQDFLEKQQLQNKVANLAKGVGEDGSAVGSTLDSAKDDEPGKEKEGESSGLPGFMSGSILRALKRELAKDTDRQFAELRGQVSSLQAEVALLKKQLAAAQPAPSPAPTTTTTQAP